MTDRHTGLSADHSSRGVELNDLQVAWLAEIGLERRILARYRPVRAATQPPQEGTSQASGGVAVTGQTSSHGIQTDVTQRADRSGSDMARMALKQARTPQEPRLTPSLAPNELKLAGTLLETPQAPPVDDLPTDWSALAAHAKACQACGLYAQRDQLVFGAGDTDQPDWLVVGEAPGKADDRTGLPFQGKAGKLLHAMMVAVGAHPGSLVLGDKSQPVPRWSKPASMYFANLIKCRPLGNRSPTPAEIASCSPYLMQQIDVLQPRRILVLGRLAAQTLLRVDADIEDLRGRVHQLTTLSGKTIPLVVTWHPAALLMHPQNKGQAWIDLNLAKHI